MTKKGLLECAFYEKVHIELVDETSGDGYLIPSIHFRGKYELLPLKEKEGKIIFGVTMVKHIDYLNGTRLF